MTTYYLINRVHIGTDNIWPGTYLDSAVDDIAGIRAAGGVLGDGTNAILAAAAAVALIVKQRGGDVSAAEAMMAAPLAAGISVPVATAAGDGLQSAQGKRIEQQFYESCDYVATNSVTSLGSVTIAGNPTPTDGQRCLAPIAGTYCTILVRSGGAWIVDPNFTVRLNARVNVGSDTWIQTAASGTAVFTPAPVAPAVTISPLGGGLDDAAQIQAACEAESAGARRLVLFAKGQWTLIAPIYLDNCHDIKLDLNGNDFAVSTPFAVASHACAWNAFSTTTDLGTAVLAAVVAEGAISITTTALTYAGKTIAVGSLLSLSPGGTSNQIQTYEVVKITGSSNPYTLTLHRKIDFPLATNTGVFFVTKRPENITIDCNGALMHGITERFFEFGGCKNITVKNGKTKAETMTSGGWVASFGGSFDNGNEGCKFEDMEHTDGSGLATTYGFMMESNYQSKVNNCTVNGDGVHGCVAFNITDCISCSVDRPITNNVVIGIQFVSQGGYGCKFCTATNLDIHVGNISGGFGAYIATAQDCALEGGKIVGASVTNSNGVYLGGAGVVRQTVRSVAVNGLVYVGFTVAANTVDPTFEDCKSILGNGANFGYSIGLGATGTKILRPKHLANCAAIYTESPVTAKDGTLGGNYNLITFAGTYAGGMSLFENVTFNQVGTFGGSGPIFSSSSVQYHLKKCTMNTLVASRVLHTTGGTLTVILEDNTYPGASATNPFVYNPGSQVGTLDLRGSNDLSRFTAISDAAGIVTSIQQTAIVAAKTVTSADVVLTHDNMRASRVELTGALGADHTVTDAFVAPGRQTWYQNGTSVAHAVTIKASASDTGIALTQGKGRLFGVNSAGVLVALGAEV